MKSTVLPYNEEIFKQNTLSIFNSLISIRMESIKTGLDKLKSEETV